MRPACTWRNAAKAVFVLPVRVPLLLLLALFAHLGRSASLAAEHVSALLPGLDPDGKWEARKAAERRRKYLESLRANYTED